VCDVCGAFDPKRVCLLLAAALAHVCDVPMHVCDALLFSSRFEKNMCSLQAIVPASRVFLHAQHEHAALLQWNYNVNRPAGQMTVLCDSFSSGCVQGQQGTV
jgi:hypothetical protein